MDVLAADGGSVIGNRNRDRANVKAGGVSFDGLFTADPRQGERVIVAIQLRDLEELLPAYALTQLVQHYEGQLDGPAQQPQKGCPFGVEIAEHQVFGHGHGYVQFIRRGRNFWEQRELGVLWFLLRGFFQYC
jgi:hypothetical protein